MNAAKQAAWLFCVLTALACSGWYFASSGKIIKLDQSSLAITPDAVISHLEVLQYSNDGTLVNVLQTSEIRHIPQNNTHYLVSPHIVVTQDNNQPSWTIDAKKATSVNGGEEIIFTHQVVIHQEKGVSNQESTLTTDRLSYFPKTKYATTLAPVTFIQPGSVVHSLGMNAYLADKRVILPNQARATYEPNHA